MDREEAIKLLGNPRIGIAEWNRRRADGEEIPDLRSVNLSDASLFEANLSGANLSEATLYWVNLSEANLSGANLSEADLTGAYLSEANLSGANLCGADLSEANLSGANLRDANLYEAYLSGANFYKANLSGANLIRADLRDANLSGANLRDANLSGANCGDTAINKVDLSGVKGLETVSHGGPSSIGIDTLFRSKGMIPVEFLRGCGVPDQWIEYLPSLLGMLQPIQFYSCFISHATKDKAIADRLHGRMIQQKLRAWYAPHDLRGARLNEQQIDRAITVYDKLLLIISRASMESDWVRWEIDRAIQLERAEKTTRLFPIRLVGLKAIHQWDCRDPKTGRDYAKEILKYHILDFTKWKQRDTFEAAYSQLIDALKADESI
jgi:uncharacterized protein YjbI with pentapeptide repeats